MFMEFGSKRHLRLTVLMWGFFLIIAVMFSAVQPLLGASLVWNQSSGTVDGYKVYYWDTANTVCDPGVSLAPPVLAANPDVGISQNISPTVTRIDDVDEVFHLPLGAQIAFSVSAYNTAGESLACQCVTYDTPAPVPDYVPAAQRDIFSPPPEALPVPPVPDGGIE